MWEVDLPGRALRAAKVATGATRRNVTALAVGAEDATVYAATSSGDVIAVRGVLGVGWGWGGKKEGRGCFEGGGLAECARPSPAVGSLR